MCGPGPPRVTRSGVRIVCFGFTDAQSSHGMASGRPCCYNYRRFRALRYDDVLLCEQALPSLVASGYHREVLHGGNSTCRHMADVGGL